MTPTEKGRRFDALYHGESNRSLATMVVNRESDLEELKTENARLHEQAARLFDKTLELGTENAKLRELCADLRFCKRNNCLTCSHGRFCDMRFDERFAELGIEVEQ